MHGSAIKLTIHLQNIRLYATKEVFNSVEQVFLTVKCCVLHYIYKLDFPAVWS